MPPAPEPLRRRYYNILRSIPTGSLALPVFTSGLP